MGFRSRRCLTSRNCSECGAEFFPLSYTTGKYCSLVCSGKAVGKVGAYREKGAKTKYTCRWCLTEFHSYYKNRRFCSSKCSSVSRIGGRGTGTRDANHAAIVASFELKGCRVLDSSGVGGGFPDLIVIFGDLMRLVEVKNPNTQYGRSGLNKNQQSMASQWKGGLDVVSVEADVVRVSDMLRAWHAKILVT